MRAVLASEPGGTEVLEVEELPDPQAAAGEVLVQVRAAGVNRADISQREGRYDPPPGASRVLGLEIAGEVIACGEGVDSWSVGDAVCAVVPGGGYAELAVVPADVAMPAPRGLSFAQAAAIPEVFTTAFDNLVTRGGLSRGERVLIHGGASGIGTAAIQIAKDRDCEVLVTVGRQQKVQPCLDLGADEVIVYTETAFPTAVRELTNNEGVDVVLDIIGAPYFEGNLACLRDDGRLVVIAVMGGHTSELNLNDLHLRRLTVTGSTLRRRSVTQKAVLAEQLRTDILPGFETGRFQSVIHAMFPLEDVAQAHALLERSDHVGKVILTLK